MGIQKAIASIITGAVAVAAQFGLDIPPEWVTIAQTIIGTALVWFVTNR